MDELLLKASKAKKVASQLGALTEEEKNEALQLIAEQLLASKDFVLEENQKDILKGKEVGLTSALIDRLTLTDERIESMAEGLALVTDLNDPIGQCISETTRPNGLKISKVRVPIGVIGMIYEARPNVTIDAASLCLKAGNVSLLRGSSSAIHSNKALLHVIHEALKKSKVPVEAIQLIEDTRRETAEKMFTLNEYIDVLIPRGGAALIRTVVEKSTIPVLETGAGNCHVFIDESAIVDQAVKIVVNAKTQRPSVCNAAETVIIHEKWAKNNFSHLVDILLENGVAIKGDDSAQELDSRISAISEEDWAEEYLDLTMAVKIVDSLEEAIDHIAAYGTKHSEAIITESTENVDQFFTYVDAAVLYHNASTRFTDGFEFGLGAEIGISTQKLHARGPMGLEELTSTKYLVLGTGQTK